MNSISQRENFDEIIHRVNNLIDESLNETIVTQPLFGTPSYSPRSNLSGVPQFGHRGANCCPNSTVSQTTINGEKKLKYLLELRKKTITKGGSAPNPQHNNQMVELGACVGERMDRDHVHDP